VDVWSKQRAETLAKANSRITNRMLTSAFSSFGAFDSSRRSLGLWFYNGRIGCYTFLPFFYGWGSPYGSSYSTYFYSGFGPYPWSTNYPTGGYWPNNSAGNRSGAGSPGGVVSGGSPQPMPMPSGNPSGSMGQPRMIDPDTGSRMPRKNIEMPSRPGHN